MKIDYQILLDFIVESEKRLNTRAGNIADIGKTKAVPARYWQERQTIKPFDE